MDVNQLIEKFHSNLRARDWNLEEDGMDELRSAFHVCGADATRMLQYLIDKHSWFCPDEAKDFTDFAEAFDDAWTFDYSGKTHQEKVDEVLAAAREFTAWFVSGNSVPAPSFENLNSKQQDDLYRLITALKAIK